MSADVSLAYTTSNPLTTYPIVGMLYCGTVLVYFWILYTVFQSHCTDYYSYCPPFCFFANISFCLSFEKLAFLTIVRSFFIMFWFALDSQLPLVQWC